MTTQDPNQQPQQPAQNPPQTQQSNAAPQDQQPNAALQQQNRAMETQAVGAQMNAANVVAPEETDPFEGAQPVQGLEQLGRAIVDAQGNPSGSPANYEELRGCPHPDGWTALNGQPAVQQAENILAELRSQLVDRPLPQEQPPQEPQQPQQ